MPEAKPTANYRCNSCGWEVWLEGPFRGVTCENCVANGKPGKYLKWTNYERWRKYHERRHVDS